MARPLRIEFEGALYHLLARGNGQQAIYETDADRERFLGLLAESTDRFDVVVHCFVLMGNHFHLLAPDPPSQSEPVDALADGGLQCLL